MGTRRERKVRLPNTPEAREAYIVGLAEQEAARRIANGTASSQLLTHYLARGSERDKLERERLKQQNRLDEAKISKIESDERSEELYANAIAAMKRYSGNSSDESDYDYD